MCNASGVCLNNSFPMQANESRSMRGMKRTAADAAARFKAQQQAQDDTAHGPGVLDSGVMDSSTQLTGARGDNRNGV